jgi:hypothetical protein
MENFSTQWFTAYYVSLGALLLSYGLYLLVKTDSFKSFLLSAAEEETPPPVFKTVLKYLLLFTIPCVVLSFTPFSWIELLFSLWSLIIIYVAGQLILVWPHTAKAILENAGQLKRKVRVVAANMMSIGVILFLLTYLLIERTGNIS